MENIPVETKSLNIVSVKINVYELVLHEGFKAVVYQYDEDSKVIQSQEIQVVGEEYNSWMNDEDMIVLILSKCGLVRL